MNGSHPWLDREPTRSNLQNLFFIVCVEKRWAPDFSLEPVGGPPARRRRPCQEMERERELLAQELPRQLRQGAVRRLVVGDLAVRGHLVDQLRDGGGEAARGFLLVHAGLVRDLADLVLAQHLLHVLARERLLLAVARDPRLHGVAVAALLELLQQPLQSADVAARDQPGGRADELVVAAELSGQLADAL